jgi:hypothetical protein
MLALAQIASVFLTFCLSVTRVVESECDLWGE